MLTDLKVTSIRPPAVDAASPHLQEQQIWGQTWQEAFEAWLRMDGRKGSMKPLREKSIEAVLQDVRHFSRFLEQYDPNAQTCAPTPQAVKAYFEWQGSGAAPASVNRRLASLRTLMRWSISAGLIEQDPTARIPRIEMSKLPPRAKDEKECKSLAKAVKAGKHLRCGTDLHQILGLRDQVIWALLKDAGLRRAEVAAVSMEGLDLVHNRLTVTGKGGKVGTIYVKASLRKALERWMKGMPVPVRDGQGTPLVTGWDGMRITAGQVARRFALISQAAGMEATCHDMRHTFVYAVVESAMRGGATRQVAVGIACQQARHGDTRITEMYLRPSFEQVAQAMEGMR
jgi:site-specific recombinase XerD